MIENVLGERLSLIVIALQEGERLRSTVNCLQATAPASAEVIVVDDGSTDGCADFLDVAGSCARLIRARGLGVAGARNRGASEAAGDLLIFLDAHMELPEGWWHPLVYLLRQHPRAAVAPAVKDVEQTHRKGFGLRLKVPDLTSEWLAQRQAEPYEVPILPGCTLAIRRETFSGAGGFDGGMIRSQGIDNEFCLRLWLLGYECLISPELEVTHLFRARHPYEIGWETVLHNRLRLALLHLDPAHIELATNALKMHSAFGGALALVAGSDVLYRRAVLAQKRIHDARWFFDRFHLSW